MEPDKNGKLTCNVCSHAWDEHTIGGNCIQPPLKLESNDETVAD